MAKVHNALLGARKKVFDKLRGLFFPANAEALLLKQSSTADEFEAIYALDSWWMEYSAFRQNFLIEIAVDDVELTVAIQEATHISINDEVYVIRTADTLPPLGADITWKIFCDRFPARAQFQSLY